MENNKELAMIIAENLVYYRKKAELTQSQLAEKLSYSDKSISKWERAEGVPDIFILVQLAKLYGLSVNDFLTTRKKEKIANVYMSKILVTLLSVGLVWFVFSLVFVALQLFVPQVDKVWKSWLLFIYALPVSSIVWIVFNNVYFKKVFNIFAVSLLCWTLALSLFLTFNNYPGIYMVFIGVAPLQVLIVLFYMWLYRKQKKNH